VPENRIHFSRWVAVLLLRRMRLTRNFQKLLRSSKCHGLKQLSGVSQWMLGWVVPVRRRATC